MKKTVLLVAVLICGAAFAQNNNVNNYKYVIVPEVFDFQNGKNEYNLNTITKLMFEKYGFDVYFPNMQLPPDLALDKCKAMFADIVKTGFLSTNLVIQLKDCNGNLLYTSAEGRSKEKERKKAMYEALREASVSLNGLNYKYTGSDITVSTPVTKTEEVTIYVPSTQPAKAQVVNNDNLLTASPTAYGYELRDKDKKTVLKMYKTTQPDYYSAQMETINGVVFKKGDYWFFEYYRDDKLVSEKLNIKF